MPASRRISRMTMIAAAVGLLALGGLTSCRVEPKSLQVTTVATGLGRPWDLAFSPGGSMFFTERDGRIRVRTTSGEIRTLADPDDVVVAAEGGTLGLAIDPWFSQNRRIYTCIMSNIGGTTDVRVVRWRVNNAVTGLGSRTDIVTGMPVNTTGQFGRHPGCRIRFGPDKHLWIGTGDAATGTVPQDPASLGGKVLRVNTEGQGVAGNAKPPFDPRIFTYGHRNVQGLAFDPKGRAYSIEHGTDRDDEVNLLVAGANYGWDPRPPGGGAGYDESQPMTDLAKFPNAKRPVWSSGRPTIAPSGGTFLTGDRWAGWNGSLVLAVLAAQELRVLGLNADGTSVDQQWVRIEDQGRIRAAVQGPDGNLYLAIDANPGRILKVTPSN